LKEGLVITIEPFLSTGADYVVEQSDGWTLCLPDDGFAAQHEHTIIITKNQPIIVTVA
jgi:methionyl aminopeptidase